MRNTLKRKNIISGIFLIGGILFLMGSTSAFASSLPSSFIDKYFEGDTIIAEKFLEAQKARGIFLPSEWEKGAKKAKKIREIRKKIIERIAKKYFGGNIEGVEEWIREEETNEEGVENEISVKNLENFLIQKIEEKKSEKKFYEILSSSYFSNNTEEFEKFLEEMEEKNISERKEILEILRIEEKKKKQIGVLAKKYFDGDLFLARKFTRDAREEGLFTYSSWRKKAEKDQKDRNNLVGNLKNMAEFYFHGDEKKLLSYIQAQKKKGEDHDEFSEWEDSLQLERKNLLEEVRLQKIFQKKYFFNNPEKTKRFFDLQKSEHVYREDILKDFVQEFLDSENEKQYDEMVFTYDDALKKFIEEEYFPTFSYRKLSKEREEERKYQFSVFLKNNTKVQMARNLQRKRMLETREDTVLEDRIEIGKNQQKILFQVDKNIKKSKEEKKIVEKFLEENSSESLRQKTYTKIRIQEAIKIKSYKKFLEASGGTLQGKKVYKRDFRYLVKFSAAVEKNNKKKIIRYSKKLEKFSTRDLIPREVQKAKKFFLQGNRKNFSKQLPLQLSQKISDSMFSILHSIHKDYKNNDFERVTQKQKLLNITLQEWKILREIVQ